MTVQAQFQLTSQEMLETLSECSVYYMKPKFACSIRYLAPFRSSSVSGPSKNPRFSNTITLS